jgi:hypothetical protein
MIDAMVQNALAKYRKRLGNVRAELVSISVDIEPIALATTEVDSTEYKLAKVAASIRGLCGILCRVIDSLGT